VPIPMIIEQSMTLGPCGCLIVQGQSIERCQ
jgi:hypothetical protein